MAWSVGFVIWLVGSSLMPPVSLPQMEQPVLSLVLLFFCHDFLFVFFPLHACFALWYSFVSLLHRLKVVDNQTRMFVCAVLYLILVFPVYRNWRRKMRRWWPSMASVLLTATSKFWSPCMMALFGRTDVYSVQWIHLHWIRLCLRDMSIMIRNTPFITELDNACRQLDLLVL